VKELIYKILTRLKLIAFVQVFCLSFNDFTNKMRNRSVKAAWRRLNRHNYTSAANTVHEIVFPLDRVSVGKFSYGPLCVHHFGNDGERLVIGNFCSISNGVKFILGGNHPTDTFSTFAFRFFLNNEQSEASTKGPITVEDDVWIGTDAIILSGVTLCKGTVVAAGSVVTRSTLPYSIVGGNPAKQIKMRFDDTLIKALLDVDFSKIDESRILPLLQKLYMPLNEKLVKEIENELLKVN
jgi:acetyltransferase-like isoleucine patch superfamily enzyme